MVLETKNAVIALFLLCVLSLSCSKRKTSLPTIALDAAALPTMHTENGISLISDSGITRYRIKGKVVDVYLDNVPEPYWHFPEGVYVEQFDSLLNVEGSIKADTAYNYERKGLVHLIGNVFIQNLQGDKISTPELFWNKNTKLIYSDAKIRIEREGRITYGVGYRSNEKMTDIRILNTSGEFEVNENAGDSIP